MQKSAAPDAIAWKKGFEELEEFRRREIRESSILRSGPALQGMLASARFTGHKKSQTGLGKLGELMAKMKRCSI